MQWNASVIHQRLVFSRWRCCVDGRTECRYQRAAHFRRHNSRGFSNSGRTSAAERAPVDRHPHERASRTEKRVARVNGGASQVKSSQVKSSQVKSRHLRLRPHPSTTAGLRSTFNRLPYGCLLFMYRLDLEARFSLRMSRWCRCGFQTRERTVPRFIHNTPTRSSNPHSCVYMYWSGAPLAGMLASW